MNLAHILDYGLDYNPEKVAFEGDGRAFTFAQVARLSENFAASMSDLGFIPNTQIAVLLPNIPEYALVVYGLWRLGARPVLLNPQLTIRELLYVLQDSQAEDIILVDALLGVLGPLRAQLPRLRAIVVGSTVPEGELDFARLVGNPGEHAILSRSFEDVAQILYTSGTTGNPKGAVLSHGNLWANARSGIAVLGSVPTDHLFCILPVFHAFAFTGALVIVPMVGGSVSFEYRLNPKQLVRYLSEPRLSLLLAVPGLLATILRFPEEFILSPALRCIFCGGGALAPQLEAAFSQRFGDVVRQGYGLTECSPYVAINPLGSPPKPGSIGQPMPLGHELAVRNPLEGTFLEEGEVGELVARGPHVFQGYWNQPEATVQSFAEGWLCTGDLGYRDEDGYYFIVDRLKDMLIVGGENVYSLEVENVLLGFEPLKEVAVVGDPDPDKGEVIHAYVSLKEGASTTEAEIIKYARTHLAPVKVPKQVSVLPELPKSATGKVLKRYLRELRSAD